MYSRTSPLGVWEDLCWQNHRMNPNWTEVRAEWEVTNKDTIDICFEKYGCEYGGKSSWQWVGWGGWECLFYFFLIEDTWACSIADQKTSLRRTVLCIITYHMDIFCWLICLISLAYTVQNQRWCFIFVCPMASIVSGTQQMLRICYCLLEPVNITGITPMPWGKTSDARN